MSVKDNVVDFTEGLKEKNCILVAISKTKTPEEILEAYHCGIRDFGENKVQELVEKYEVLPRDIRWHMVGHLQTNKIKMIVPFVHLIQSVDSLRLLQETDKQAEKKGKLISCLLQVHIAEEETKFGFDEHELNELFRSGEFAKLNHVFIRGLMGMATFTDDTDKVRGEFKKLKLIRDSLEHEIRMPNLSMEILSMGMSSDYKIALEEGSNMIRIGTALFGSRSYAE